jgi:hypothetical protein
VDIWETADGRKFRNENEAIKHEEYLNKMNIINILEFNKYLSENLIKY